MTNAEPDLRPMGSERYRTWLVHWIKRLDRLDPYGQQASTYRVARLNAPKDPPSPLRMLLEFGIVLGAAALLIVVITLTEP